MPTLTVTTDIRWDVKPKNKGGRPRLDEPGYHARHKRVYAARGKASGYACENDCGKAAHDWATIHGTQGLDVWDYVALCKLCHYVYDAERHVKNELGQWAVSHD
jgi:hypothetical protein